MTDQYPPFRLDLGGDEPPDGGRLVVGPPSEPAPGAEPAPAPGSAPAQQSASPAAPTQEPAAPPASPLVQGNRWGAGRVIALAAGVLALLAGAGLLVAGTTVAALTHTVRDADGYFMSPQQSFTSSGHAIVSDTVHLPGTAGADWVPADVVGRVKITAHGPGAQQVFIGVAPAVDVDRYLLGVSHSTVTDFGNGGGPTYRDSVGTRSPQPPGTVQIWTAHTGTGQRTLTWEPTSGDWSVVVMNNDGRSPVVADVAVGATLPVAGRLTTATVVTGAVLLLLGLALMIGALLARRSPATPSSVPDQS